VGARIYCPSSFSPVHSYTLILLYSYTYYRFIFEESLALYVVSASEELVASPGAAEGGRIPLLAAESGPAVEAGAGAAALL
jgi:hypothetical protein